MAGLTPNPLKHGIVFALYIYVKIRLVSIFSGASGIYLHQFSFVENDTLMKMPIQAYDI